MALKIYFANDHAATDAKKALVAFVEKNFPDIQIENLGVDTNDRANYPDYAKNLCHGIQNNEGSRGVLLCGSGIGMSMAANRYKNIRAALCHTEEEATLSRQHNDANVLCLGARTLTPEMHEKIFTAWVTTEFEGGRHTDRVNMFSPLGEEAN